MKPVVQDQNSLQRLALGIAYRGEAYQGWQSQVHGQTVQDHLQKALCSFILGDGGSEQSLDLALRCSGRTDTGVHALNQVVHLDVPVDRPSHAWVRGLNRYLPADISVQWCQRVTRDFDARRLARRRRYVYLVVQSAARPALELHSHGWVHKNLNQNAMQTACSALVGEHDFTAFRSSQCQAPSPIKTLYRAKVIQLGSVWRFEFEGSAFLHHMVRNLVGALIYIGQGRQPASWMAELLDLKDRSLAAPTFAAQGLYFLGPVYDEQWGLPTHTAAMDSLPGGVWRE